MGEEIPVIREFVQQTPNWESYGQFGFVVVIENPVGSGEGLIRADGLHRSIGLKREQVWIDQAGLVFSVFCELSDAQPA